MQKLTLLLFVLISSQFTYSQTTTGSFVFDGVVRTYRIYVPAIYDGTAPVPLVFNLHGYGSNSLQQDFYGNFKPVADTANFILVHPQGLTDSFGSTHWNALGTSTIDDVGFLSALIDTIYSNYNINGNRIYSTGMSNGGFMSYKLACDLSGRIAAIASVTGSMIPSELTACETNHPMPVMQIHGTADSNVPYEGGSYVEIPTLVDYWVNFNECDTDPVITEVPDIDTEDGCTATHYVYENGLLESTVELYKINDGGHTWPGASFITGVTNNDFNASAEIWRFFSQYTLNHLTSSIDPIEPTPDFEIYPNPASSENVTLKLNSTQEKTIGVYNFLGQPIYAFTTMESDITFSIKETGVYFVSITTNGQTITKKLIRN